MIEEFEQKSSAWCAQLIHDSFLRSFLDYSDSSDSNQMHLPEGGTKMEDLLLPLESTTEMLQMMTQFGFSQLDLTIAVEREAIYTIDNILSSLESNFLNQQQPFNLANSEQLVVDSTNYLSKFTRVPNMFNLSERLLPLIPILQKKELTSLIETFLKWQSTANTSSMNCISPRVLEAVYQKKEFFDQLNVSTRVQLLQQYSLLFMKEVSRNFV